MKDTIFSIFALLVLLLFSSENVFAKNPKPLKVFILAGQSNMQGHAHVRTFDAMRLNPKTESILETMLNKDGSHYVCDKVWISSIGSSKESKSGKLTTGFGADARGPKIGPEFTFGIYMEKLLDEPILIIKTAWGGKSLHTDFRSPSSGPYVFSKAQLERMERGKALPKRVKQKKREATGHYYRLMMSHIKEVISDIKKVYPEYNPKVGYELAGFVWFQGWNDMVDPGTYPYRDKQEGYKEYSTLLANLIRDVRKELSTESLPFVIGVMGVGGPTNLYGSEKKRYQSIHQNFRDAMAAPSKLKEFQGNVSVVLTENYWDMEVERLRKRERQFKPKLDEIKKKLKTKEMDRVAGQAALDELYEKQFNERELKILKTSTSNFDFHYMGSAGIMAQVGKGFAEAMYEMLQSQKK